MDFMRLKMKLCLFLVSLILFIMSLSFVLSRSVFLLILECIFLFLFVWLVPMCKHRENLWMFILVAIASTPINMFLIFSFICSGWFEESVVLIKVLCIFLLYCVVFSIEEIVFGTVTRLIWKKQCKLL